MGRGPFEGLGQIRPADLHSSSSGCAQNAIGDSEGDRQHIPVDVRERCPIECEVSRNVFDQGEARRHRARTNRDLKLPARRTQSGTGPIGRTIGVVAEPDLGWPSVTVHVPTEHRLGACDVVNLEGSVAIIVDPINIIEIVSRRTASLERGVHLRGIVVGPDLQSPVERRTIAHGLIIRFHREV